MFEYKGKKVLVVGAGKSGVASCLLLAQAEALPVLYDGNAALDLDKTKKMLPEKVRDIPVFAGELPESMLQDIVLAVLSPGVPLDKGFALMLKEKGIPLTGEIELAYGFEKGTLIGITGTNGKTTTTTLVGEIMKAHAPKAFTVGNIGEPYTASVLETTKESVSVAEISSFQLETIHAFRPYVSAILNITPDHLDRHHSMENYAAAKERIAENQSVSDFCVLNYEDQRLRDFGENRCRAKVLWFSSKTKLEDGYYLEGDKVYYAEGGVSRPLLNIRQDMNLVGICNVENVMAAIAIARACGVPMTLILETVKGFKAVEHRIEYSGTAYGVDYYNDSKATNPDSAIQGIRAMEKPTVLIGGGYDKGNEFDEWIEAFDGKVKHLVLLGQTKEKIAACARKHGFDQITMTDSFEECLKTCASLAKPGDAVLLSPACASWGMFPNFEVRGQIFKEFVRERQAAESASVH